MKQLVQSLRTGKLELIEAPVPTAAEHHVLIRTRCSLVSPGTERMLLEFGRAGMIGKLRQQPERAKLVLEKMRKDGVLATMDAVRTRLDQPLLPGYSNVGEVCEAGRGVSGLRPGDRVVSNGPHAEYVLVPQNLVARVPEEVEDDAAVSTVLGSVALQGLRLARPELGESVVIYGLGLIGQLALRLARVSGCRVCGVDTRPDRLALAVNAGAEEVFHASEQRDLATAVRRWAGGGGADAVIITAAARGDEILIRSSEMARTRGRIVLVGVVEPRFRREEFYKKELTFQVSCSYGPGRYDRDYETGKIDYPEGYLRWTVQRNFSAYLHLLKEKRLHVSDLISVRYPFDEAVTAYEKLLADRNTLGILLDYGTSERPRGDIAATQILATSEPEKRSATGQGGIAVVGAGAYAASVLLPAMKAAGLALTWIVEPKGARAAYFSRKYSARAAGTGIEAVLKDPATSAVAILTRHDSHARLTVRALQSGKAVFVEKPMALDAESLQQVLNETRRTGLGVFVGFNRRFSRHARAAERAVRGRSSAAVLTMTINAGPVPPGHWVNDPEVGGGRILGEACHFIDLAIFLTGRLVRRVSSIRPNPSSSDDDSSVITLELQDGSCATIHYLATGARAYPKERIEAHASGTTVVIDNFRRTIIYSEGRKSVKRSVRQDKGHVTEMLELKRWLLEGGEAPVPLHQAINASLASIAAAEATKEGRVIDLVERYGEDLAGLTTSPL